MAVKIFYHSADLDGHCSGAIARRFFEGAGAEVQMFPINHGDVFPWEQITKADTVCMLDFSLPVGAMYQLKGVCGQLVFIDHHVGIISQDNFNEFFGVRDTNAAACALTWNYFYPGGVPDVINLFSYYDIWKHDDPKYTWENVEAFHYRISSQRVTDPSTVDGWEMWSVLFELTDHPTIEKEFIEDQTEYGLYIKEYVESHFARDITHRAFKVQWEGYTCLVLNGDSNAASFITRAKEFGGCNVGIVYNCDRGNTWVVSLRTTDTTIDLSKLAQKYGGNGHAQASGFSCKKLPFKY